MFENELDRVNITDYITECCFDLYHRDKTMILPKRVKSLYQAQELKRKLDNPSNTEFKSVKDIKYGEPFWKTQRVDFVPSNLPDNEGYIFYFLCNICKRKVKYLYRYSLTKEPWCRECLHLNYQSKSRKRRLAKYIC